MHIIKVDAIDSTNSYAKEMVRANPPLRPVCVVADRQLQGRGQRGTHWASKPGQNLTFSVLYPDPGVAPGEQFLLSAAVAVSLVRALEAFNIPKLKLKWPNDIMSAKFKVGGILIENIVADGKIASTIIGIGLNVNQTEFDGLPSASSLKLVTGVKFDLEEVLQKMLGEIESGVQALRSSSPENMMEEYKELLFRRNIPSTFQSEDRSFFTGIIEDVTLAGRLVVRRDDDVLQEFDLKEIRLCF